MIRPTSSILNRLRDPLESDSVGLLIKDRLSIVMTIRNLVRANYPKLGKGHPIAEGVLAMADTLEKTIKEVG